MLFVGGLTQHKGIGYALDAIKLLGTAVDFTMVGQRVGRSPCIESAIREHRWIPSIPHEGVLREMAQNDVLLLPSLSEGFGLVMLEALSRGVPVITTRNSGGPDIIRDGEDGFFVPIRSAEAIAERLVLLDRDRDRLDAMSTCALQRARAHSWAGYRSLLVSVLRRVISPD